MDEVVAVFSPAGSLVMSNLAYSILWSHGPAGPVGAVSGIAATVAYWRCRAAPSILWAKAGEFVSGLGGCEEWEREPRLSDGRLLACRFAPLTGGASMIAFRVMRSDNTLVLGPLLQRSRAASA